MMELLSHAFYIETKTKKSRSNVLLLQNREDSVQRELNAVYGRAQFGDQNMGLIRQQAAVPKFIFLLPEHSSESQNLRF